MNAPLTTALPEAEAESSYLGQFIPVHYHHNMLMDENRMGSFRDAIDHAVKPGAKVLELGGGTGVLSCFAAANASKVWCIDFNPDLVREARRILAQNPNGHKVEVVQADAFDYLPPEPVDVVICEMIHVAMLREKQVAMMDAFKRRYLARFGGPLPLLMPEAVLMAVQPLYQNYDFHGFVAPIVQFQKFGTHAPRTIELGKPVVYSTLDFSEQTDPVIRWHGELEMTRAGKLNALRFLTKNVLAVVEEKGSTIDWRNDYMSVPLPEPIPVRARDRVRVSFAY